MSQLVVCAWCKRFIKINEFGGHLAPSHSACDGCTAILIAKAKGQPMSIEPVLKAEETALRELQEMRNEFALSVMRSAHFHLDSDHCRNCAKQSSGLCPDHQELEQLEQEYWAGVRQIVAEFESQGE